jgi:ParB-like chromosome segregation protein Spo0J
VQEEQYTKELARQIQENKELNPLIVVKDAEGHYILEGAHRFDALRELGIDSFPALMVHDLESLGDIAKPALNKAKGGLTLTRKRYA